MRYFMQAPICKGTKECDLYLYEPGRDWDLKLVLLVFLSLALSSFSLSRARVISLTHVLCLARARSLCLPISCSLLLLSSLPLDQFCFLLIRSHTHTHTHTSQPPLDGIPPFTNADSRHHWNQFHIHHGFFHVTMLFSAFQEQVLSLTHSLYFLTRARSLSRVIFPTSLYWEKQNTFELFCH